MAKSGLQDIGSEFCLQMTDGVLSLGREHEYYDQVDADIHLQCAIMWLCSMDSKRYPHWEGEKDEIFWNEVLLIATRLFAHAVLPELLSGYFIRQGTPKASQNHSNVFCFCQGLESGKMVACDGAACQFKWFHFSCVGMKRAPKGKLWSDQSLFCSVAKWFSNDYWWVF